MVRVGASPASIAALDALAEKSIAAHVRGDLESAEYLDERWNVLRVLVNTATIEAGDAPTPDASPLWRDSDREDWMRDGSTHLELVADPGVAAHFGSWDFVTGTYVAIETADEMVHVESEHLPALIAMLQEVQRRIEAGDAK